MSVHEDDGLWIARWGDRQRRFDTKAEAEAFEIVMHRGRPELPETEAEAPSDPTTPDDAEPEPEPDRGGTVDTAAAISAREQVSLATAKRWLAEGFVRWDEPAYQRTDGQLIGETYRAKRTAEADMPHVVIGLTPIPAEKARRKALRERREATALKHRVALGFVNPDGTLAQGAIRLDGTRLNPDGTPVGSAA